MDENDLTQRISFTARFVSNSYPLVDQEDIVQELWLWATLHADKIDKWGTDEHGSAKLNKALRNAATRFSRREQSARRYLRRDMDY